MHDHLQLVVIDVSVHLLLSTAMTSLVCSSASQEFEAERGKFQYVPPQQASLKFLMSVSCPTELLPHSAESSLHNTPIRCPTLAADNNALLYT